MKAQLLKLLIAFLIFNPAFLIKTNAQIVYTDVSPDITKNTNGAVYNLDLNNDGTTDFNISIQTGNAAGGLCSGTKPYARIIITPGAGNFVSTTSTSPAALIFGAIINDTNTWSVGALYMARDYWACVGIPTNKHWQHSTVGQWLYVTDKYLGLRFTSGGNTYYGWARLNAQVTSNATATFTIKDYAYDSIPNQPILAGAFCPTPTVTLSTSGSLLFCKGDNVTLTAYGTGSQYQWKKNEVNIGGAIQQSYVIKTSGTYNVIVTNGCGSSEVSNSVVVTVTLPCKNSDGSLSDNNDGLEHLSVYPNPATNSVTIKIPSDEAGEIQIINLFGRVVETHNYASLRDGELQIDVAKFPAGIYVVRWGSGENYETKTFSVIK